MERKNDKILLMIKEAWRTAEGETKIRTKRMEITISPHPPLVPTRISEEQLVGLVSFCQQRSSEYRRKSAPSHIRAIEAIKEVAPEIYQSFFLPSNESKEDKIYAFSEVELRGLSIDCVILGLVGIILVEVKKGGHSGGKQLKMYKRRWQERFPEIPLLTAKAGYRGNKVILRP